MTVARLALEAFPAGERQAAWRDALAEFSLQGEGAAPAGSVTSRRARSGAQAALLAGGPQTLLPLRSPEGRVIPALVLRGRALLAGAGRRRDCAAGDLLVLDTAADWRLETRTEIELVMLAAPRAAILARLGRNADGLGATVLGATVAALAAKPLLRTLAQNLGEADPADLTAIEIALVELVSSALLSESVAPDGGLSQAQAEHFRRLAAAVEARLTDADLDVGGLARQEGFSVRYVQRLFALRGQSFSDYVRRERLERCRTDLADPNRARESVATIAWRWGFRDQAHFTRAFRAAFGLTPTEARRPQSAETGPAFRGMPASGRRRAGGVRGANGAGPQPAIGDPPAQAQDRHHLPAHAGTVHWGYLSHAAPPILRVAPGDVVTVETLTQHGGDDLDRFVTGDPGAESIFAWTREHKAIDRRGAGPMNASIFGRGAGEGFGVHICTGPIHVRGAEPGDILEVEILDLAPRPCANPAHAGKAFASNVSAWWGYQYDDLLAGADRRVPGGREVVTIYEIDLADPGAARALYSYRWTPQTDPSGVRHERIDYPGLPVDPASIARRSGVLAGVTVPARPHFGFIGVAPREAEIVDTIPPGYFGGNIDNWRAGKGAKVYLPVAVAGALLSVGDGHFAQGDGETNGTGLECSLTGTLRLGLHKAGRLPAHLQGLPTPMIETPTHWVVQAFSFQNHLRDLGRNAQSEVYARSTVDLALRNAFRQARRFLMDAFGLDEDEALSLMSVAVDFGVTQVADGNFGVHASIAKEMLGGRLRR